MVGDSVALPPCDEAAALDQIRVHFQRLVNEWKQQRVFLSSLTDMVALPAYRGIVQMGLPVVPLLLAELEHDPDWWFTALEEIVGCTPVLPEDRGRLDKMSEFWLKWGRAEGFSW